MSKQLHPIPRRAQPQARAHPAIKTSAVRVLLTGVIYTFFVTAFSSHPSTTIGEMTVSWVKGTENVAAVIAPMLESNVPLSVHAREAMAVYHHVLAASLLVAAIIFIDSRKHWRLWAALLHAGLRHKLKRAEDIRRAVAIHFGQMVVGTCAVVFICLLDDFEFGAMTLFI